MIFFGSLMGNNELVRICTAKSFNRNSLMISAFASEISRSKRLRKYTFTSSSEISHTEEALQEVIQDRYLDRKDLRLLENITLCLDALRMIQIVHNRIDYLKSQSFDLSEHGEHYLLLDILWINLTVITDNASFSVKDQDNGPLQCRDWKRIGFQSNDPSTDFRGMGILGLHQLVYFTTKRTLTATKILGDSKLKSKQSDSTTIPFPFAVTGIHITQFVLSLFLETRLHQIFFSHYETIVFTVSAHHSRDDGGISLKMNRASYNDICIEKSCDVLHDVYCDIYEEFFTLWMKRSPSDIMAFSSIFDELKILIRAKYHPI